MRFLTVLLVLSFISCEYKPPYSGVVPISLDENLSLWDVDSGISLVETTSDAGTVVYSLGLINILSDDTTNYSSGSTGEWIASSPVADKIKAPSIFQAVTDPINPDNRLLLLELKREPLAEYIYYPLNVDYEMSSYIFRYDYRDLSKVPGPIYLSIGRNDGSDDVCFTRDVQQKESGTAVETLNFIDIGTYHIRFGNADILNIIPTFSIYLDNVYLFKNSNHAISQRVTIKEAGIYRIAINAKALSSSIFTLKISGYSGTFPLTDTFAEYSYYIRLDRGDTTIEIMPVDAIISNRIPGAIEISSIVLEFHPDKSSID
ncbi:MAG: hypothetical protein A2015_00715 [Spirochaetes bacterium GWF1_31_7]|nr:MAG: hypothetical protein A2Y30_12580 [Spirochaetes bacterium GWE1_32_154]OHD51645.1 MAG: hypothetical protein A2Y29_04380 [Spirochaetes bacterium GWE2_31_10]OHD51898.1 MAG: hypothetical protein A2015_00715 [Spirochaetes bacterium GWF1_31_7]OHD81008.1 MAG: hypothetical protein A2355_08655 [Spirochaetes bacterium RIFOXYB1_FULL_32_8]HBD93774.1 hypothetical protein [Spirochaetia bacterium]